MHLGHRCRGQRGDVERGVALADRCAQRRLDRGDRLAAIEGCDAVLQQGELVGDVRRQQVAARRQDLAELDEDGPSSCSAERRRAPRLMRAMSAGGRAISERSGLTQRNRRIASRNSSSR
jgi:hypothetical protein